MTTTLALFIGVSGLAACGAGTSSSGVSDSSESCVLSMPLSSTQPSALSFAYQSSTSCNYFAETVSGPMSLTLNTPLPAAGTLSVNVGQLSYTASGASQTLQAPAEPVPSSPMFPMEDATGSAVLSYPAASVITSATQPPAVITITLSVTD